MSIKKVKNIKELPENHYIYIERTGKRFGEICFILTFGDLQDKDEYLIADEAPEFLRDTPNISGLRILEYSGYLADTDKNYGSKKYSNKEADKIINDFINLAKKFNFIVTINKSYGYAQVKDIRKRQYSIKEKESKDDYLYNQIIAWDNNAHSDIEIKPLYLQKLKRTS